MLEAESEEEEMLGPERKEEDMLGPERKEEDFPTSQVGRDILRQI